MGVNVKYLCNKCGKEIDASDSKCPHCGADIDESGRKVTIDITEVLRQRDQIEIAQIQKALKKEQKVG
ncbi:zinc-ribbon domain-containing protein [Candidatus Bathyarchaeota archaeon]|nr:MAG: zinc-ribbon domain-containing protein [Candidatus Bathyarchaeota archaeon]